MVRGAGDCGPRGSGWRGEDELPGRSRRIMFMTY